MAQTSQFCTFYLDKLMFGVELQKVQEVLRHLELTGIPLAPDVVSGLMNLRGQIITAIDLRRRLELPNRPDGMLPMNVVVRSADGAISFLVDEIGDAVEVDEDSFERPPRNPSGQSSRRDSWSAQTRQTIVACARHRESLRDGSNDRGRCRQLIRS